MTDVVESDYVTVRHLKLWECIHSIRIGIKDMSLARKLSNSEAPTYQNLRGLDMQRLFNLVNRDCAFPFRRTLVL